MCIAFWVNYDETFTSALAFDIFFVAERKAISGHGAATQFKVQKQTILRNFCKFAGLARKASTGCVDNVREIPNELISCHCFHFRPFSHSWPEISKLSPIGQRVKLWQIPIARVRSVGLPSLS